MAADDARNEEKITNRRIKGGLLVSEESGPIPKLPHEHDESVESQTGGHKSPDAKRAPNIGPPMTGEARPAADKNPPQK